MRIWIAGEIAEVTQAAATGLVTAIVTNPTVIARWTAAGRPLEQVCSEVCTATGLPLYVQLRGPTKTDFLREWEHLRMLSPLIRPKLPATLDGLAATAAIEHSGTLTLVTTVCSVAQAYVSAAAGATAICPYLSRLSDAGENAGTVLRDIAAMYARHAVPTLIMPASVRTAADVATALNAGAHGVIVFWPLFQEMIQHPVMKTSLAGFEIDWAKTTHHLSPPSS